jgi:integrase
MAGKLKVRPIDTPTARKKLAPRRQPYWEDLIGKHHLGWQRDRGKDQGRWMTRSYLGEDVYTVKALGALADDAGIKADGEQVLSYDQAHAKALAIVGQPLDGKPGGPFTVRVAWQRYLDHKRDRGQPIRDAISRGECHILPARIADIDVEKLTVEELRQWFTTMATSTAQKRPVNGGMRLRAPPANAEDIRKRQVSANRVLAYLKACLNHAYDEGKVPSRSAWDRKLKLFKGVNAARLRYLKIEEAQRLLNAADLEFRPLLRAALETGARYGDLTRLCVHDFNADSGTVQVRQSKTGGRSVHVILTEAGGTFFRQHCAGRRGDELMFRRADGTPWQRSNQTVPMRAAVARAKITPNVTFHALRHTWASHAVMAGVPLLLVAKNLGHTSTRMVEQHYGHLSDSYATQAIRAGAPVYGLTGTDDTVVPLSSGQGR